MKVPVLLFAYARPEHTRKVLSALREDRVPLILAYCDGPKHPADTASVEAVREMLRRVDWCEIQIVERQGNLGLGTSLRQGIAAAFADYERIIIFEDDIVCIPGTYRYFVDALDYFHADPRVMSICGWNHPRLSPMTSEGYFDGRFSCWGWATWRRAWEGMETPAIDLLWDCRVRGRDVNRYGWDISDMAVKEQRINIWAVRFSLLHLLKRGLCFHPPKGLVENIGFDGLATNTMSPATIWQTGLIGKATPFKPPSSPVREHPDVARLWGAVTGVPPKRSFRERVLYLKWSVRPLIRHVVRMAGSWVDWRKR